MFQSVVPPLILKVTSTTTKLFPKRSSQKTGVKIISEIETTLLCLTLGGGGGRGVQISNLEVKKKNPPVHLTIKRMT